MTLRKKNKQSYVGQYFLLYAFVSSFG